MLHIEPSTIIFQLVNFLILLVVLTRFFYRPVLRVMQAREDAIARRLHDADERAQQADVEREHLSAQVKEASAQAEALLAAARTEAAETRTRLLEQARHEAAALLDEAKRTVVEQEREAVARIEERVRTTAVTIAGRLIREAAGPAVHDALVARLASSGVEAGGTETESVRAALTGTDGPITIEAAYPLTADMETRLRQLVAQGAGAEGQAANVAVRVQPALLAGVRILAGEAVIDLSLQRVLADLERGESEAQP